MNFSHRKKNLLFQPCNMAAVQNLYIVTSKIMIPLGNSCLEITLGSEVGRKEAWQHGDWLCLGEFRSLRCVSALVYVPPSPNDLLHLRKQKGLKSSTFCTINHGFRGSVVTLLRNRVNFGRHLGFLAHCRKTFLTSSLAYYPNSVAGFRLLRLISCGYISPNLGSAHNCNKNLFSVCRRRVANNHRAIRCNLCLCWCHIECGKVTATEYTKLASSNTSFSWNCSGCITTVPDPVTSILNESSDNVNIVHVQSTPSQNSSPSSCQLPTSSAHIKDTSGLKGMIINSNGLKGPSRLFEFHVLDFHKPDSIFGCESKFDCEVPPY